MGSQFRDGTHRSPSTAGLWRQGPAYAGHGPRHRSRRFRSRSKPTRSEPGRAADPDRRRNFRLCSGRRGRVALEKLGRATHEAPDSFEAWHAPQRSTSPASARRGPRGRRASALPQEDGPAGDRHSLPHVDGAWRQGKGRALRRPGERAELEGRTRARRPRPMQAGCVDCRRRPLTRRSAPRVNLGEIDP